MTSTKQEPAGRLFDVTGVQPRTFEGEIEKVPAPRRNVSAEGIDRLAVMLSRGQLVPAIGRRVAPGRVLLYAGQRRLLAAKRTHDIAGTNGCESVNRVACLIVLMLDYEPTEADIRRLQAAENARETPSVTDQQAQFQDVWSDRAGLGEEERVAAVCSARTSQENWHLIGTSAECPSTALPTLHSLHAGLQGFCEGERRDSNPRPPGPQPRGWRRSLPAP